MKLAFKTLAGRAMLLRRRACFRFERHGLINIPAAQQRRPAGQKV